MSLFFQPRMGFHFGKDYFSFSVLETHKGKLRLTGYDRILLPENSVRFSPLETNLLNVEGLKKEIEKVLKAWKKVKIVGLSLPDPSIRAVLVELKGSLPRKEELDQVVKWNIEKTFLTQLEEAQYSHQLLGQSDESFIYPGRKGEKNKYYYLLGTAVTKNILVQYQSLFAGFHVILRFINISSVHLFNFYHDFMVKSAVGGDFLFVHLYDQHFTFITVQKNLLRGIRTKGIWNITNGTEEKKRGPNVQFQEKVLSELERSFQEAAQETGQGSFSHLFILGLSVDPIFCRQISEKFQISVEPLDPARVMNFEPVQAIQPEDLSWLSPAMAAVAGK